MPIFRTGPHVTIKNIRFGKRRIAILKKGPLGHFLQMDRTLSHIYNDHIAALWEVFCFYKLMELEK